MISRVAEWGKCRIKVIKGATDPTDSEKDILSEAGIGSGIRLACATKINGDITLELPETTPGHQILTQGDRQVDPDPHLRTIFIDNPAQGKEPHGSDWQFVKEQISRQWPDLGDVRPSVPLLRRFSENIHDADPRTEHHDP